jgi:hypothetical protein
LANDEKFSIPPVTELTKEEPFNESINDSASSLDDLAISKVFSDSLFCPKE